MFFELGFGYAREEIVDNRREKAGGPVVVFRVFRLLQLSPGKIPGFAPPVLVSTGPMGLLIIPWLLEESIVPGALKLFLSPGLFDPWDSFLELHTEGCESIAEGDQAENRGRTFKNFRDHAAAPPPWYSSR